METTGNPIRLLKILRKCASDKSYIISLVTVLLTVISIEEAFFTGAKWTTSILEIAKLALHPEIGCRFKGKSSKSYIS